MICCVLVKAVQFNQSFKNWFTMHKACDRAHQRWTSKSGHFTSKLKFFILSKHCCFCCINQNKRPDVRNGTFETRGFTPRRISSHLAAFKKSSKQHWWYHLKAQQCQWWSQQMTDVACDSRTRLHEEKQMWTKRVWSSDQVSSATLRTSKLSRKGILQAPLEN